MIASHRTHTPRHPTITPFHYRLTEKLSLDWHRVSTDHMLDHIQHLHNFYVNKMEKHRGTKLFRLLKVIRLIMAGQLRGFVERSISRWETFCVEALTGVGASARPIFRGELVITEPEPAPVDEEEDNEEEEDDEIDDGDNGKAGQKKEKPKKKPKKKGKKKDNGKKRRSKKKMKQDGAATKAKPRQIEMVPSAGQLKESLLKPLHSLVSIVRAIKAVDATLLPLLQLEPEAIFNLRNSDPMCAEADAMLVKALSKISTFVDNAVEAPLDLLSRYRDMERLATLDVDTYVSGFELGEGAAALDSAKAAIDSLMDDYSGLESLSGNQERFSIIAVDCSKIKEEMRDKARRAAHGLMRRAQKAIMVEVHEIREQYKAIHERVQIVPTNEEELAGGYQEGKWGGGGGGGGRREGDGDGREMETGGRWRRES